jgi:hypothetical protein
MKDEGGPSPEGAKEKYVGREIQNPHPVEKKATRVGHPLSNYEITQLPNY